MKYPEQVVEQFILQFGRAPEMLLVAPGRINLIGEHTDYTGGFVLPAAIDKAIYFAAARVETQTVACLAENLHEFFLADLISIQKHPLPWANFVLGVYDQLFQAGHVVGGIQMVMGGDIPVGSGLSSSAALESGVLHVLNALYQLNIPTLELVKMAQRCENTFIGLQCGIMDMFAAQMGQKNCAIQLDCRSLAYEYIPFESEKYTLLLCDSGVKHALADSEYNTRRNECEESLEKLQTRFPHLGSLRDLDAETLALAQDLLPEPLNRRCNHVVSENQRVLEASAALKSGDFVRFGQLLFQSHHSLQHDYAVSCPELDLLVATAQSLPGVLGARMMGGGFGGCSINLVEKTAFSTVEADLQAAYHEVYGKIPHCFGVSIESGVHSIPLNDTQTT